MKGLVLTADWDPRPGYTLTESERTTRKAVTGSSVWRRPHVSVETLPDPKLGPREVLIRPRACGVCGSDVHFYETDKDGYMLPWPHALPCRDRSRIFWRDRGGGQGSPGSAAWRHGHLRGDDLVRRMHALPQRVSQPVRAVGGDRFHHQRRAGRPDRRRCQILLEDQCPGGSLRQRGVGV